MNAEPEPCMHQDLKDTTTIVRNMDIEPLNADLNLCGHQTSQKNKEAMDTSTIGTTILGKVFTIIKSMDISLITTLRLNLVVTTKYG